MKQLKTTIAADVLNINGRTSSPFADLSAVKGNKVKTSVQYRKLEISEKRVTT